MIAAKEKELHKRALEWQKHLGFGEIIQGFSTVGGGSLPEETLPTWLLAFNPKRVDDVAKLLRDGNPPIICRIQESKLLIDTRTVLQEQEESLLAGLKKIDVD
jgi:L-seryl-tRNA(Ser) seleniumtransferase